MLWMVKKVFFGEEGSIVKKYNTMPDMNLREIFTLTPLIVLIFWMGLWPTQFLKYSEKSLQHLIDNKSNYTISIAEPKAKKVQTAGVKDGI